MPGPCVTLHLPGALTCREDIHLNINTHTHTLMHTYTHTHTIPHTHAHAHTHSLKLQMSSHGTAGLLSGLLLLRDWSWGKAVTPALLHSPSLVKFLVRMMTFSCLLSASLYVFDGQNRIMSLHHANHSFSFSLSFFSYSSFVAGKKSTRVPVSVPLNVHMQKHSGAFVVLRGSSFIIQLHFELSNYMQA